MAFNDTVDRNTAQLKNLAAQPKAYNTDDAYTKSNHAADINDLAEERTKKSTFIIAERP